MPIELGDGICARCGKSAPKQFVVCDECQRIADQFNEAIRKVAETPKETT